MQSINVMSTSTGPSSVMDQAGTLLNIEAVGPKG